MQTITKKQFSVPKVKVGASRQIAIPKELFDALHVLPGDYFAVELRDEKLILTPQAFVERRLAEGLLDLKKKNIIGPFSSAKKALAALDQ